jgi:hypothetical protein
VRHHFLGEIGVENSVCLAELQDVKPAVDVGVDLEALALPM